MRAYYSLSLRLSFISVITPTTVVNEKRIARIREKPLLVSTAFSIIEEPCNIYGEKRENRNEHYKEIYYAKI